MKYPPKRSKSFKERSLYCWIANQDKSQLNISKIKKLELLPEWAWDKDFEKEWDTKFSIAKKHIENKDCNGENRRMVKQWIKTQRKNKRTNKNITQERILKLESINGWMWNEQDSKWNDKFNSFKDFILKNKRYPLSYNGAKEKVLTSWLRNIKSGKKGMVECKLTIERIEKLESLPNWSWEDFNKNKWDNIFEEVKCFIQEYKRYPKYRAKNAAESKIGLWIFRQKQIKNVVSRGVINKDRFNKLESLPNWKW